ncbi:MAG: hypothetical protein M3347_10525 [Armatimonadota bacterium]|nr:hypothetical protein [Armatimonadota bacterium]
MQRAGQIVASTVGLALSSHLMAHAYPTSAPLWGPSGLGHIPTTDTVPARSGEVGLGYERIKPDFGGRVHFFPVASGTLGFKRGEVGIGYLRERLSAPGFSASSNFWNVHAKYRAWEHPRSGGAVAVGLHHIDLGKAGGHVDNIYITGSVPVVRGKGNSISSIGTNGTQGESIIPGTGQVRIHLGLLHQRVSNGGNNNETRPMLGLAWRATPEVTVAADFVPKKDNLQRLISAVARYEAPRGWGAQVGIARLQDDNKIFASVVYRFGTRR